MIRRNSADSTVSVIDLVKRFGSFTAVDRLSFNVGRGEVFGLLGPNGAGKSTTIRMLCGLLRPTSGKALVLGNDASHQSREIRGGIGYMSQQFSLYEDLTVVENVKLYGGLYGLSGARYAQRERWVLDMAGLSGDRDSVTSNLSRGHRQRLALGCALIHEPRLLFLDEPTSGVDPITRRNFWNLIHGLSDGGVTILVTTHYMDEAGECHRLALINDGRVIAIDTPERLRSDAMPSDVLRIEAEPLMAALSALQGSPLCLEAVLFGNSIHAFVKDARRASDPIRELLESERVVVKAITRTQPSLEDVFVGLIEKTSLKWGNAS